MKIARRSFAPKNSCGAAKALLPAPSRLLSTPRSRAFASAVCNRLRCRPRILFVEVRLHLASGRFSYTSCRIVYVG